MDDQRIPRDPFPTRLLAELFHRTNCRCRLTILSILIQYNNPQNLSVSCSFCQLSPLHLQFSLADLTSLQIVHPRAILCHDLSFLSAPDFFYGLRFLSRQFPLRNLPFSFLYFLSLQAFRLHSWTSSLHSFQSFGENLHRLL